MRIDLKYFIYFVFTISFTVGWHDLVHSGHPFLGGAFLGAAWCCGAGAILSKGR